MARSLITLSLGIAIGSALLLCLPPCEGRAQAAALTGNDNARAKQARLFYKEGQYEEAAKIFSSLSIDYPEKVVFTRNLGACYYHLRRPEPAISNLREYLQHGQDISADDRSEVEGWLAEMQKLRDQPAATAVPSPTGPPPAASAQTPATPTSQETPAILPTTPTAVALPPLADGTTNLASSSAAPETTGVERPIYKKWWLWTAIGGAVVAGTVTAILLARGSGNGPCSGIGPNCVEVK